MKRTLRILAFAILILACGMWAFTGANRGWTKTSRPVKKLDEVTGIEGIEYEKWFSPGVDFLGFALFGSGVLTGLSFAFRKPKIKIENE